MKFNRSYIVRLFVSLLIVFLLLLISIGIGVYKYAKQAVGKEFVRLNQASLMQLAASSGQTLSNVINFGERVASNSKIQQLALAADDTSAKEIHSILSEMLGDFNDSQTNGRSLMDVYVLGCNGLTESAYSSRKFTLKNLQNDIRCTPLFQNEYAMVMLPTSYSADGGAMNYSFQIVYVMRDLLNQELRGLVVLDISELLLYNTYKNYISNSIQITAINEDGIIISNNDKRLIGMDFEYNKEMLEELASQDTVDRRIVEKQFLLYERIPGSDWLLIERMPAETAFGSLTRVRNMILMTVTVCTLLVIFAVICVSRSILLRIMKIKHKMEMVIQGDLTVRISVKQNDELGSIESAFNSMVKEIGNLIEEVRQSEQQKRAAEMDFLHAQINSHFIHNTLTSIRFMLEMGKINEAGEMIFYFSKLLRQTLSRSSEFISLREEIETLKSYVNLQNYRYQNVFQASYHVDADIMEARVPALILQPVVENAIFHGVGHDCIHILMSGYRAQDKLILIVSDDGVGMPESLQKTVLQREAPLNRVGLCNVNDRIQMNYGKAYGITINSELGQGTRITFTLPLDIPDEEDNE